MKTIHVEELEVSMNVSLTLTQHTIPFSVTKLVFGFCVKKSSFFRSHLFYHFFIYKSLYGVCCTSMWQLFLLPPHQKGVTGKKSNVL